MDCMFFRFLEPELAQFLRRLPAKPHQSSNLGSFRTKA